MRTKSTVTELLGRVIAPLSRCLTPAAAKEIVSSSFIKNPGKSARLERHPRTRVAMIVVDYQGRGWSAEEIARQYAYLTLPEAADQSHPEATRQLVARTRRLRDLLAGFGRRHRGLSARFSTKLRCVTINMAVLTELFASPPHPLRCLIFLREGESAAEKGSPTFQ